MLLNLDFSVEITNDGENNKVGIRVDKDKILSELFTAIRLTEETVKKTIEFYFKENKITMTESEFKEFLNKTTFIQLME